jgi:hypothetical protein
MKMAKTSADWKTEEIVPSLIELATKGLVKMYDPSKRLFCYRMREVEDGSLVPYGTSRRYTIITLIGLCRLEEGGRRSPIDVRSTIDKLVLEFGNNDNVGDLGLLIWLCALAYPEYLDRLYDKYLKDNLLERFGDFREARTMELSWLLTGMSYAKKRLGAQLQNYDQLAEKIYGVILCNYGGKAIFRHSGTRSVTGRLRGRIGSFADQVYPSYALLIFSYAFNRKEALDPAIENVKTLCRLQGEFGQWWWHYDAKSGGVVGRYPVYSVHQEGMAPMTLFEAGKRAGVDFSQYIHRGLDWIIGKNEINECLIDKERQMIWRSISPTRIRSLQEEFCSVATKTVGVPKSISSGLKVLRESRPYCFGWLLYAFAAKDGWSL